MARSKTYSSKLRRQKALAKARQTRWKQAAHNVTSDDPIEPFSRPVTRSESAREHLDGNYVINLKMLMEGLRLCAFCGGSTLSLEDTTESPSRLGLGVMITVKCKACGNENKIKPYESHRTGARGPEAVSLNSMGALAMIHTGQGYTHLNGDLALLGLGSISRKTYKKREREVGKAIETVCEKSCNKWKEKERAGATCVDDDGDSLVPVSYDGAWQKRGKARDSSTGFGTVIGQKSGKVLDYGVKCTRCRTCEAASDPKKVPPHDCRKNFNGSSKSMEPEIAVECFNAAPAHNLKYSEYVGDEDATTEAHVRYRVNYQTEKRTDQNHATRTLGSRLYEAQKSVKSLSATVINYIKKLFAYCISQNQGNQENIKSGLEALVAHAFGDHGKCESKWCGALKNPSSYKHQDLPGGQPLKDENLRAAIENAIKPFHTPEWYAKLAKCGSSQANESVNGVVSTKAPKNRHYGGSESLCYRVSSGICQFNEGATYLTETTEELGIAPTPPTTQYVTTNNHKRKREREKKSTRKAKRRRKELKKQKSRRKEKLESKEGKTYQTGIGVTQEGKTLTKGMIDSILKTVTEEEIQQSLDDDNQPVLAASQQKSTDTTNKYKVLAFDLETTGLKRESEILQISCVSLDDHSDIFNAYMVPDERISPAASKVTNLSTGFRDGKKILLKGGTPVDTPLSNKDAMTSFVEYLEHQQENANDTTLVLVAHNGATFDFPVLIHSLKKFSLLERANSMKLCFMDSLPYFRSVDSLHDDTKKRQSFSLSSVYSRVFGADFAAHDALSDCRALVQILQCEKLDTKFDIKEHHESLTSLSDVEISMKSKAEVKTKVFTLHNLPISKSMKEKIAKQGIDMKTLETVFTECSTKGLIAFLSRPISGKPRVTKNRKVLTEIVTYFEGKK